MPRHSSPPGFRVPSTQCSGTNFSAAIGPRGRACRTFGGEPARSSTSYLGSIYPVTSRAPLLTNTSSNIAMSWSRCAGGSGIPSPAALSRNSLSTISTHCWSPSYSLADAFIAWMSSVPCKSLSEGSILASGALDAGTWTTTSWVSQDRAPFPSLPPKKATRSSVA